MRLRNGYACVGVPRPVRLRRVTPRVALALPTLEGELARKYSGRFPFELAPHVFAVAEAAYRNLCSMQEDQIDSWVSRAIHDSQVHTVPRCKPLTTS